MKPNFALSLSYDGIQLLHRTPTGAAPLWTLIGEVAIDDPDLASQLAVLRKTGLALDPQGLRTKLLIPNDQIKYMALDTTRADDGAVRAALDGATPYAVSDLVIDYVRGGGRTYVAAVSRDTLAEAEAFAAEHRFGPICFAAVPESFTFVGEPFFGPTSIAERLIGVGQRVERDEMAVIHQHKPRRAETSNGPAVAVGAVDSAPAASVDIAPDMGALADSPPLDIQPVSDPLAIPITDEPAIEEARFIEVLAEDDIVADRELVEATALTHNSGQPMADPIAPLLPQPVQIQSVISPEPVFASRGRTLRADPTDMPVNRQPLPAPPGSKTASRDDAAEPMFSRRIEPPVARPAPPQAPLVSDPQQNAPAFTSGLPMTAPQLTGAARQTADAPAYRPFDARRPAAAAPAVTDQTDAARSADVVEATVIPFRPNADPDAPLPATPVTIQTVRLTQAIASLASASSAKPNLTAPNLSVPADALDRPSFASRHGGGTASARQLTADAADQPAISRTPGHPAIGGTRAKTATGRADGRGKPRYLALILTLLLLAALAAVAAWASALGPSGLAALFGRGAATEVATELDTDVATTAIEPSPLTVSNLTAPALIPQADTAVVPAVPAIDTAPDVASVPGLVAPDSTVDTVAAVSPEISPEPTPDLPVIADTGTVVSPAEADRIYDATGVWLRAPRLPLIPTADPVGALALAATDSAVLPSAQPQMPPLAGASPDQSMLTPVDPPPPGTVFARDARGFVLATAQGTLTPDGILVYAGAPAVIPPNRPGSAEPAPVAQQAPRIIAASAPPLAPRPAAVAPDPVADPAASVQPSAGGVALDSLGPLVRPLVRPTTPAPEVTLTVTPAPAPYNGPAPQLRPQGLTPQTVAFADPTATPPDLPEGTNLAVEDTVAAILAAAPPDPVVSNSPMAVANARIPEARPQNFADVVASAQSRLAPAEPQNPSLAVIDPPPAPPPEPQVVPEVVQPTVQPEAETALLPESAIVDETVAPNGPIPGGVAANATLAQAMDLRGVNLIGVFGRPNDRRALVRLANGQFVRVGVGDSLDGGQVAAIGDNALNYVKRGQTITIAIPNG